MTGGCVTVRDTVAIFTIRVLLAFEANAFSPDFVCISVATFLKDYHHALELSWMSGMIGGKIQWLWAAI